MTTRVPFETIERIVGRPRHATVHYGRAVPEDDRVYIMHSHECVASGRDLRLCLFSVALDRGITDPLPWASWRRVIDRPVPLHLHHDGWLVPDLMALRADPDRPTLRSPAMTRDPDALHVGAIVDTPHGRAVIKARRTGPITTWLALDWWWRESQISIVEPAKPVRRDCGHGGAA